MEKQTPTEKMEFVEFLEEQQQLRAQEGLPPKLLALTYRNLAVVGKDSQVAFGATVWSEVDPRDIYRRLRHGDRHRALLKGFSGQVRPGEMMLVVGRPGSGCTTFMRALSNRRAGYVAVQGDVRYGSMGAGEAAAYRHEIVFNSEEDVHFPTLTVGKTAQFALRNKVPAQLPPGVTKESHVDAHQHHILGALGIRHTANTLVGNEFIRGVSGGERKRVSLAEVMAGQAAIQFWDNSTRGLDASTALDFGKRLREMADVGRKTVVASFYQTGNAIYDLFDKVTVIAEGRPIYYGPRADAKKYFEDMGFECPRGANVADFLTSVTVPTERRVRTGYESRVPSSVDDFVAAYERSQVASRMAADVVPPEAFAEDTQEFRTAVATEKARSIFSRKPHHYTVTMWDQVRACTIRQFQILWGDRMSTILKILSSIVQALVTGSLFYDLPNTSASTFTRPGAINFPLIFFCFQSMAETTASFMGRTILTRQREFGFYRPTAFLIANIITDIPITVLQVSIFNIVFYFLVGLQHDAAKFFTNWVVMIMVTLCFLALFRSVGAMSKHFGSASRTSGLAATVMLMYTGYLIPFQKMHPWFRWIFYVNPAAYAFESLLANEYRGLLLECVAPQLVPFGNNYTDLAHKACTVSGSTGAVINGEAHLKDEFNYSVGHIWRGFGVIAGLWVFFSVLAAFGLEAFEDEGASSVLLYKRGSKKSPAGPYAADEEKGAGSSESTIGQASAADRTALDIGGAESSAVFSWKDLNYTVSTPDGPKQLLHNIGGFVKPGQLCALMGSSGAGKTTLLDVLAQRKDSGIVEGEVLIDGRPLGISFQRSAGYCEQNDVHESTATVKEALVFSARLRQPASTSLEEKLKYVDTIIRLLELDDIQDALIGAPGAGLTIEQRKRLTIGVELCARPSLVFLDEPTSGLDGQSAFNIVRFMKKLSEAGQAVLCTIHQPSASLFEYFDSLLLLAKGGKTVYFGETGKDSSRILEYFARNGAPCPAETNPAEHIVDVVQGRTNAGFDWVETWGGSPEASAMLQELERIKVDCLAKAPSAHDDGRSFAAPLATQLRLVLQRQLVSLWRNPDYTWNKMTLHILQGLFGGFTFWKLGSGTFDLQLRLLAMLNFIFVAPGLINQLQPLFLHNRDVFEAREKKSKTYGWVAFIAAQVFAEIPVLVVCATLYFACWYFTAGFPAAARVSGQVYLQMILYEFLYTAIGQGIATYAPNEYFASLLNPVVLGAALINFAGVVVPYAQLQPFWRYWMYYLDPFNYLVGGLLTQLLWDVDVSCAPGELSTFAPPPGQTCGAYMADFLAANAGYLVDPAATAACQYCEYSTGADYARTLNLNARYYAWRNTGITALFCVSTYALVFLMMKLRSKKTKSAKAAE